MIRLSGPGMVRREGNQKLPDPKLMMSGTILVKNTRVVR